jgi:metallophosphoesterase superfamily enzyme
VLTRSALGDFAAVHEHTEAARHDEIEVVVSVVLTHEHVARR